MPAQRLRQPLVLALAAACLAPITTAAQNRILNGGFDVSLASWSVTRTDGRSANWTNDDAQSNAASGSVELRHAGVATGFPVMVLQQCVSLSGMPEGNTLFGVRSKALQESAGVVQAHVALAFYRDFSCADLLSPGPNHALALNSPNWHSEDTSFHRNADANSLLIQLGLSRSMNSGSAGAARFDELYVGAPGAGPVQTALKRWTVDAGGGLASGSGFSLAASLGQFDPGSAQGGATELQGGFWFAPSASSPVPALIFRNGFETP